MSKEKTPKIKRKTTALDIVSRVITCGLAAAIPAALYFLNVIYYEFESSALGMIGSLAGNENDTGTTYGYIGIKRLVVEILPLLKEKAGDSVKFSEIWASFEPLHTAIYVTLALLAAALMMALAIFFTACFTNSNKLPAVFGVIGFVVSFSMVFAFRRVTAPIVDGSFSFSKTVLEMIITAMFGSSSAASLISMIVGSLSDFIVKFTVINLSTAWIVMMICFMAIAIWHGAMLLVNMGDNKGTAKASK